MSKMQEKPSSKPLPAVSQNRPGRPYPRRDVIQDWKELAGTPATLENYLALLFPGRTLDELEAEELAQLPNELLPEEMQVLEA